MENYIIVLLTWNLVVMFIYGLDKFFAKTGRWRISEFSLLLCSFIIGGVGAIFGMILFNHKTSKIKFRLLVPLSVITGIIVAEFLKKIFFS